MIHDPDKPRILIIKLSAVGDVVHTLPALNALRTVYPHAHIGWVAHPGVANLLENHPQIDELIILPRRPKQYGGWKGFREIVANLRSHGKKWDYAIDFQGLTKSGLVMMFSGAAERIGFGNKWSREINRLFVNHAVSPAAEPVIQMNIGLLEPLNVSPDSPATAYFVTEESDETHIAQWATGLGIGQEKFLIIDPFAGWETKLWHVTNWVELARLVREKFGLRSLVFHGPHEEDKARQLAELIGQDAIIAPPTTLRQYIALLKSHAAAMVAADTGPMHIAAANRVPVVALFGPSDSNRNAPTFSNAHFEVLQDWNQPCAGTFTRKCPHHEPGDCMKTLTPQAVLEKLDLLLS